MNGYTRGLSEKKQAIQDLAGFKIFLIKDCQQCEWVYERIEWKKKQAIQDLAGFKIFFIKDCKQCEWVYKGIE